MVEKGRLVPHHTSTSSFKARCGPATWNGDDGSERVKGAPFGLVVTSLVTL